MSSNAGVVARILSRSTRNEAGCLICAYMKGRGGYPLVRWFNEKTGRWSMRGAHVVVDEHHRGPIPKGLVVRHRCDTPGCVDEAHLVRGTQRDNVQDCIGKRRASMNDRHKWSKLSVEDVIAIRASALSSRELAAQYGVTYRHIRYIVTGAERKYAP